MTSTVADLPPLEPPAEPTAPAQRPLSGAAQRMQERLASEPQYQWRDRETEEADAYELLQDCLDDARPRALAYQTIARVNESFAIGDQWWAPDFGASDRKTFRPNTWFEGENLPRVVVNKVGNLNITLAALLTRNRPTVKAVAASSEPEDQFTAQVGQRVIENLQLQLDTAQKTHQSAIYAGQHGMAGFKAVYSAVTDSVEVQPLTIFNVLLDPTVEDYRQSEWCCFVDYRSKGWAKKRLKALAQDLAESNPTRRREVRVDPPVESYDAADGTKLQGVPCFELWHKPTDRYPQGLYAFFCGQEMLEFIPRFPNTFYDDGAAKPTHMFPCVLFKMRVIRANLYGHTNFSDCINLQRALNETNSRILDLVRKATKAIMVLPKEHQDGFDPKSDGYLYVPSVNLKDATSIGFIRSFPIPAELFNERAYSEAKIADVMGLNQITSGAETRSISGRAIENIVELDAQKNSDATKGLEDAQRDLWTLILRLVQYNYTTLRTMKITDGDVTDILEFRGADIAGVDIRLEPASETDSLQDAKQADADTRATAGLPPIEASQGAAVASSIAASFAEHVIGEYLQNGRTPDLQPDDTDWTVFLDVLEKYKIRAVNKNRPEDYQALRVLEQGIRTQLVPMAGKGAQPAPGDAQGPPGGAPPDAGAPPPPPDPMQGMPA